jgi:hypothetical protein
VHIENTISQQRPLSTVEELDFTVRWENLRDHVRGRAVDVIIQATVDGAPAWSETSIRQEPLASCGAR